MTQKIPAAPRGFACFLAGRWRWRRKTDAAFCESIRAKFASRVRSASVRKRPCFRRSLQARSLCGAQQISAGVHSAPHFRSQYRHATVIKGVWWTGIGPELDFNRAVPLKAGSYMFHPAGGVHWDGAGDEEVVVQIVGEGPVETTPVGAAGAPQG